MEQSPSWEGSNFLASQEILHIVHYCVKKSPLLVPIQCKMNPFTPFNKISLRPLLILFSKWTLFFNFAATVLHAFSLTGVCVCVCVCVCVQHAPPFSVSSFLSPQWEDNILLNVASHSMHNSQLFLTALHHYRLSVWYTVTLNIIFSNLLNTNYSLHFSFSESF